MKSTFLKIAVSAAVVIAMAAEAHGYSLNQSYNGRLGIQDAGWYDLPGLTWEDGWMSPGGTFTFDYAFEFPADPRFTDPVILTWKAAMASALLEWSPYATVRLGVEVPANSAHLLFQVGNYITQCGPPVLNGAGHVIRAPITFNMNKPAYWQGGNPVVQQIKYSATHEIGHALGLHDLYRDFTEEFVDHPTLYRDGRGDHRVPAPDRDPPSRKDNIMQGTDDPWGNPNYAQNPVVDNDEIAGVSWLWGGKQHQIVTGDLRNSWNGLLGRDTEEHHGDMDNPLGWWDYRGTVSEFGGSGKARISLEFIGYETFIMNSFPGASWIHIDGGDDIHIFECQDEDWVGNFDLWVKSIYTNERRIWASVFGDGRTDLFSLEPNISGLTHEIGPLGEAWAMPFGPIPEPSSVMLILGGLVLLPLGQQQWKRIRS